MANQEHFVISGSSTSYRVNVGPANFCSSDGALIAFPGGGVTVPANANSYIYVNASTNAVNYSASISSALGMLVGSVLTGPTGFLSVLSAVEYDESAVAITIAGNTINHNQNGVYVGPRVAGDPHDYSVAVSSSLLVEGPTGNNNIAVAAFGGSGAFRTLTASGTQASPTAIGVGTPGGEFDFCQFDGSVWATVARIVAFTSQNQTSSAHGNDIYFETTPNSSTTRGTGTMVLRNWGGLSFLGASSDLTAANGDLLWRTDVGRWSVRQNGAAYFVRTEPRITSLTDAATVTPVAGTYDIGRLTSLSQSTTIAAPTTDGSVGSGYRLTLRIKSAASQTLTWNAIYRGSTTTALPAATTGSSKTDYFEFLYNVDDTKWDIVNANMGH